MCSGVCVKRRIKVDRRLAQAPLHSTARGIVRLRFGAGGLEAEDCFALLHQVEAIARNRFEIRYVRLKQIHLARLTCEQSLLFIDLLLQVVDLRAALHQFLVRRHKQAHDHEPDRNDEQDEKNTVQSLPNGSFATRAEIAVGVIHLGECSAIHGFVTKFFLDPRQLIVFREPVAPAQGSRAPKGARR